MCLLCFVGISERIFKKMHSNEDLDCKRFADRLGDTGYWNSMWGPARFFLHVCGRLATDHPGSCVCSTRATQGESVSYDEPAV